MDQQIMITNKNNNILRRMNRESQTILSKNKPQVRIIHIFAPEIIKTDPANFRELVQRLTGKPSLTREKMIRKRDKKYSMGNKRLNGSSVEIVKREEAAEIWRPSSSSGGSDDNESGGFLKEFEDDIEDGLFMEQFGLFQPSMDLPPNNHNPVMMHHHHLQNPHPKPSSSTATASFLW